MNELDVVARYQAGEKMSSIAKFHGVTIDRVRACVKRHGVYVQTKTRKHDLPEEQVVEMYKNDVSVTDIAAFFNLPGQDAIVRILTKHKVRKPNWLKTLPWKTAQEISDPEAFRAVHERLPSMQEKAEYFNCGIDQIRSAHKRHDIPIYCAGEVRSLRNQKQAEIPFNRDNFIRLYDGGLPVTDIAEKMGISVGYLRKTIEEQKWWPDGKPTPFLQRSNPELLVLLNDRERLTEMVQTGTIAQIKREYGGCLQNIYNAIKRHGIEVPVRYTSSGEREVGDLLESWGIEVLRSKKSLIPPYELDIYCPEYNIAVEYCGLYWHSEAAGKDHRYHLTKLERCAAIGIRLITIFEDEFINHRDIVIAKLKRIFKQPAKTIAARRCSVRSITPAVKNAFLDQHHLQGADKSSIHLGLFHGVDLVAVLTMARPSAARNSAAVREDKGVWELNRYAAQRDIVVVGGMMKLLTHFMRSNQWRQIYTYADRRWSDGSLYKHSSFCCEAATSPNYWYYRPGTNNPREYRYNYRKDRLVEEGYDPNLTEREIMESRGFTRIWDCGMLKFSLYNDHYASTIENASK